MSTDKADKAAAAAANRVAAAAAAATRVATAAASLKAAVALGEKQFGTALKTVKPLKDSNYQTWRDQIERTAYTNQWHPSILYDDDGPDTPSDKHTTDVKYAYMLCLCTTDDSPLADILQPCPRGDAKAAFLLVASFFHRRSAGGCAAANKSFYHSSMASTDTNVIQWIATITRNAAVLNQLTNGSCAEDAQMLQLIEGLLPEFKDVKQHVFMSKTMSLIEVRAAVMDYATNNDLLTLTKRGASQAKNKIFSVDGGRGSDKTGKGNNGRGKGGKGSDSGGFTNSGRTPTTHNPTTAGVEDCQHYCKTGACNFMKNCKYNHPPDRGAAAAATAAMTTAASSNLHDVTSAPSLVGDAVSSVYSLLHQPVLTGPTDSSSHLLNLGFGDLTTAMSKHPMGPTRPPMATHTPVEAVPTRASTPPWPPPVSTSLISQLLRKQNH